MNEPEQPGVCPGCAQRVDPLRSAVSIVGGRLVHYCSAACREGHLGRELPHASGPGEPAIAAEDDLSLASCVSETPPSDGPDRSPDPAAAGFRRDRMSLVPLLPRLLAFPALLFAGVLINVAGSPRRMVAVVVLSSAAVLAGAALDLWHNRDRLVRRLPEEAGRLLAAGLLILHGIQTGQSASAAAAVFVCAAFVPGDLLECLFRRRSGVVADGCLPARDVDEWKDNSATARIARRVAGVLEWVRLPLALGLAVASGTFMGQSMDVSLLVGAIAVLFLSPRLLRLIAFDAHRLAAIRAGRLGVVVRDGDAVSRAGSCRSILFMADALWEEAPTVRDWSVVADVDEAWLRSALYDLESRFADRYGTAICAFLRSSGSITPLDVADGQRVTGPGVTGTTASGRLLCGARMALLQEGVSTAAEESWAEAVAESGRRPFFVALNGQLVARFALEDRLRPQAADAVRQLLLAGFDPVMMTSAELGTARAMGERLGLSRVLFETGADGLESVFSDFESAADRFVLVGGGALFEEFAGRACGSVHLSGAAVGVSPAGIDARRAGPAAAAAVLCDCLSAVRSVRRNLIGVSMIMVVGLCLSTGWPTPGMAVGAAALVSTAAAACTLNGPFQRATEVKAALAATGRMILQRLGVMKR